MRLRPDTHVTALVVASAGGHLVEAERAIQGLDLKCLWATASFPHTRKRGSDSQFYYLMDPERSVWRYAVNSLQSLFLICRVRPSVVITTGAGIALATCIIGKLVGAKLIVIETAASVDEISRTGNVLYRMADLFIVQWEALKPKLANAQFGGALI